MYYYTLSTAVIAIIAGLIIAICTKKEDYVIYGKLDKAGQITNIIMLLIYLWLSPLYLFFGIISSPRYDGFLGVIGSVISVVIASASLFCGIGLGLSVALRKKGKSKASFFVQFAGFLGIGITLFLYFICAGNLLRYLN